MYKPVRIVTPTHPLPLSFFFPFHMLAPVLPLSPSHLSPYHPTRPSYDSIPLHSSTVSFSNHLAPSCLIISSLHNHPHQPSNPQPLPPLNHFPLLPPHFHTRTPLQKSALPEANIIKMRTYEEKLANARADVRATARQHQLTSWENKSHVLARNALTNLRYDELKAQQEASLLHRRNRLAQLLDADSAAESSALKALEETPVERRARLFAKAQALNEKREAERQALADQLLARAFRDNFDPVRTQDSKLKGDAARRERDHQLVERAELREAAKTVAAQHAAAWEANRLEKEKRYAADKEHEIQKNAENVKEWDEQLAAVQKRRAKEEEERQAEIASLHALWRRQEEDAKAKAEEQARLEVIRKKEVAAYNEEKQAMDAARAREEEELDLKYLQEALAIENAEAAREAKAKEQKAKETRQFLQQTMELMKRDEEDTAEQDRLIAEQNKRQEAIYDARLAREQAARDALMREVVETREQQIRWKDEERQRQAEEVEHERMRFIMESATLAEMEDEVREMRQQGRLAAAAELMRQIEKNHQNRSEAKEEERLDNIAVMDRMTGKDPISQKYMGQIKAEEPPAYYGRKKVEWFY